MSDMISRMDAIQACQVGPSDEWSRSTRSGYAQASTDCQMNILRIPALPSVGVTVKPLEWDGDQATDLYGDKYEVVEDNGAYEIEHPRLFNCYHKFPTIEAAKAAAQADYAARIIRAIDVQPAPAPSPLEIQTAASNEAKEGWTLDIGRGMVVHKCGQVSVTYSVKAGLLEWAMSGRDIHVQPAPEGINIEIRSAHDFPAPSPNNFALSETLQGVVENLQKAPRWDTATDRPAPSPDVAALRDAAQKVVDRFLPTRSDLIFSKRAAIDALAATLARKGGA